MTQSSGNPNLEGIFRLSPMQELMLLHSLAHPDSRLLVTQFSYELKGNLDVPALRSAWEALVERHASLRTAFVWEGLPHPVQVVRRRVKFSFEEIDLRDDSETQRKEKLGTIRSEQRRLGFDLLRAPLIRMTAVRLRDDLFAMIGCTHHLVVDRLCIDSLFEDLAVLYRNQIEGSGASLGPAGQFKDYIAWILGQDEDRAEQFWRGHLKGLSEPTLLSAAQGTRPRRSAKARASSQVSTRTLGSAQTEALRRFVRGSGLTVGSVIQGAIGLWIASATRKLDVVFGLTVSGRPMALPDCETTVGSFINNVPLRLTIDPSRNSIDWVREIQAIQAQRNAHEHISPVRLKDWSELPAAQPFFDLLALINPSAPRTGAWPDLEMGPVVADLQSAYPMTLLVGEASGNLELSLVCREDGFSRDEANSALAQIERILDALTQAEGDARSTLASVTDLPALSEIAQSVDELESSDREPERPGDSPEAILSAIWSELLGFEVGIDEDLIALGATSLQTATAFAEIEKRLGRSLPLSVVFRAGCIRDLLTELDQPVSRSASLVEIQPHGARPLLFTVPGIGGNVVGLAGLARALGPDQPFFGLESPGLDGRSAPMTRIEDVAAGFVDAILDRVDAPFVLFGICWGSAVAYEMAQQLSQRGRAPESLILMDPTAVRGRSTSARPGGARMRFLMGRIDVYRRQLIEADWAGRARFLREKTELLWETFREGGAAPSTQLEFNQLKVSEANLAALGDYRHAAYQGPVTLIFTDDRPQSAHSPESAIWEDLIAPPPEVIRTPGMDTGDALTQKHVGKLAESLEALVDSITDRGRVS